RLHGEGRFLFVQPAERRISQTILIAPEDAGDARAGQVVVAELTVQPDGRTQPIGRVVEVLGEAADPGIEIEIALRKPDLPFKFSARAEPAAWTFPPAARPGDRSRRDDSARNWIASAWSATSRWARRVISAGIASIRRSCARARGSPIPRWPPPLPTRGARRR